MFWYISKQQIYQSSNTELSGIPPDLGEKEIFNLGESPRSGGINIFQPLIWHENFNDTKECLLWKIFFLHVECIDIRVFKNVGLIREKIEKNTKMQTHFPPDLGDFLKARGIFWNYFSPRSGGICNFDFKYWFRGSPCKLSVTWLHSEWLRWVGVDRGLGCPLTDF